MAHRLPDGYRGRPMEFFPGFAWPVPRAFASAVSAARFEQGDVFYDAPAAYEEWKNAPGFRFRVQVLDPPRSARAAPADSEGDRFAANWASPVTFEISDYESSSRQEIRSTQGRLFTCLWRGDSGLLRGEGGSADPLPLATPKGARELQKHLEACLPELRRASGKPADSGSLFVSVLDTSSESSLAKARAIESAIATRYAALKTDLSPGDAGVPDASDYHPALRVRGVWVEDTRPEPLAELLKSALYGPSRVSGEGGGPDRFKLERHGLLASPGEATSD